MKDTPQTDSVVTGISRPGAEEYGDLASFCRQLERELAQATQDCIRLDKLETKARLERDALGSENEHLRARVKELMDSLMLGCA